MYIFSFCDLCKSRDRSIFLAIFMALLGASNISAQTCLDDVSNFNKLNCTANDVVVAEYTVTNGITTCIPGTTIEINADARLVAQASLRYDVGFFVAEDGGNALTGTCHHDYLPPPLSFAPTVGPDRFSPYFNAEVLADTCGDIEKGINTFRTITGIPVICQDTDNDGFLDIGTCTSWDNHASTGRPNSPYCTNIDDTLPNTPSKCRCEMVNTNVTISGGIIIEKVALGGNGSEFFTFDPSWNEPNFSLFDGQSHSSPPLVPGTYSVTETLPVDWENISMACDDGSTADNITLSAGEVVTCTFINVFNSGQCVCDDGIECTVDFCDENDVCHSVPDNGFCNDGEFCNGVEVCSDQEGCISGTPVDCSDSVDCTNDVCDETLDTCVNTPDDSFCSDNAFCNGDEVCDPLNGCLTGTPPCHDRFECTEDVCIESTDSCEFIPNDQECDDADFCTIDSCSVEGGCLHERDETLRACKKRGHPGGSSLGFVPVLLPALCPPIDCLIVNNPGQRDVDDDGIIDSCDLHPLVPEIVQIDLDADGVADHCDICPAVPNPNQLDSDSDGIGDACDQILPVAVTPTPNDFATAASKAPAAPAAPQVEEPKSSPSSCSSLNDPTMDLSLAVLFCALLFRFFAMKNPQRNVRKS